jgi:hypothetical protein
MDQCILRSGQSCDCKNIAVRSGDVPDTAMTQVDQMIDSQSRCSTVVDLDARRRQAGDPLAGLYKWHSACHQGF